MVQQQGEPGEGLAATSGHSAGYKRSKALGKPVPEVSL